MTEPLISLTTSQIVVSVISEHTDRTIAPGSKLVEDLDMDSLTILEMTLSLESEFGFKIDYVASKMRTVSDVVTHIGRLLEERRLKTAENGEQAAGAS